MNKTPFKAGMYLLETLTSGMYNDPLSIYREYIQNSVDSIDISNIKDEDAEIKIDLNPVLQSVTITDNGKGVSANIAESVLSSIGSSTKLGTKQRGFRGIGRLGGIAFAKKVMFKTTSKGESIVSIQEWDCEKLRELLGSAAQSNLTIEEVFSEVSKFTQTEDEDSKETSYFEVKLLNVESFRNYIFDIQRIKKYLMQVAPVPFNPSLFSFGDEIQQYLKKKLNYYGEYRITLNDEQLFKPYSDELIITSKQCNDRIESVKLVSLHSGETAWAHGWFGKRRDFLGAIKKGANVSGLRIKVGNLQVGDHHLLDRCFRENRFNSYVVGEIHVCDPTLLPNSRRDDFVDNKGKTQLYNLIECEIGLPVSKKIRYQSRVQAKLRTQQNKAVEENAPANNNTVVQVRDDAKIPCQQFDQNTSTLIFEKLLSKCGDCQTLQLAIEENSKQ